MKSVVKKLGFIGIFLSCFLFAKDEPKLAHSIESRISIVLRGNVISIEPGDIRNDNSVERKRSHKRRRVVRKPRKGRQR
tara:strand:+ start:113 stop:349 length:237 start_codon:yes stop_codon:yes gene_type:complete